MHVHAWAAENSDWYGKVLCVAIAVPCAARPVKWITPFMNRHFTVTVPCGGMGADCNRLDRRYRVKDPLEIRAALSAHQPLEGGVISSGI
jgi:hypothetical protein